MPSYEDVSQRAGSLQAMTGLTQQEFEALLPHFEHALAAYLQDRTIRHYQGLYCTISQRPLNKGGGTYAQL
jgi:hypothetical protein